MTGGAFGTSRRLTSGERGRLGQLIILVAAAPDDQRHDAIAAAVAAARYYRHSGVAWDEIAAALGISTDELRTWRGTAPRMESAHSTPPPARTVWELVGPPAAHPPPVGTVLVAMGDATVNGNDFASEAACVRKALRLRAPVIERANIEIAELRREIEQHRPAVVHLAAHVHMGLIHLSIDGAPMAVLPGDIARAIQAAVNQPYAVVFNCCDTEQLAHQLARREDRLSTGATLAIGWRGEVTDEQARTFASMLYGAYDGPHTIIAAFDDARLTVTARWPGQAMPLLVT